MTIPAGGLFLRRLSLIRLATLLAAAALSGCFIEITVPVGGRVETLSGSVTCESGDTCDVEVTESDFSDSFVAIPDYGYVFSHWLKRSGSLFGDQSDAEVTLTLQPAWFDGNSALMALLSSDQRYYLEPVFVRDLSVQTYAIVDTAQNTCYSSTTGNVTSCGSTGGDAEHDGNQPSYSLSQNGAVIVDNVTGLVWEQSTDTNGDDDVGYDDKLPLEAALQYCDRLVLGERSDWRLPSIKEMYSLMMFTGIDPSGYSGTDTSQLTAFLDPVFDWIYGDIDGGDDRIIDGQYATSTLYTSTTMNGDATMFGLNTVDGRIKGYPYLTSPYYVRCVAGNTHYGTNAFSDNNDGTISDTATGLMWQYADYQSSDWPDAVDYCLAAATGGYNDWRLPNVKELHSLLDYSRAPDTSGSAAIDPIFSATQITNEGGAVDWGSYWSSTSHVNYQGSGVNAAYVAFGRALGFFNNNMLDVHGAGAQRSDHMTDVSRVGGAQTSNGATGLFYYHGPQGDILRNNHMVRCVRDQN